MAQDADLPQLMTVGVSTNLATGMMFGVSRNISSEDLKYLIEQRHAALHEQHGLVICHTVEVFSRHHPQTPRYKVDDDMLMSGVAAAQEQPACLECFAELTYHDCTEQGEGAANHSNVCNVVNPDANKEMEKQSVTAVGVQAGSSAGNGRQLARSADEALANLVDPSDPGKISSKKKVAHVESGKRQAHYGAQPSMQTSHLNQLPDLHQQSQTAAVAGEQGASEDAADLESKKANQCMTKRGLQGAAASMGMKQQKRARVESGQDEVYGRRVTVTSPSSDTLSSTSSAASSGKQASADSCKMLPDGKDDGHETQTTQAPTNVSDPDKIIAEMSDMMDDVCPSRGEKSSVSTLRSGDYGYDAKGTSGDGSPDMPATQSPYTPHANNLSTNEAAKVAMRRDRHMRETSGNSGRGDGHDSDDTPKPVGKSKNIMNHKLAESGKKGGETENTGSDVKEEGTQVEGQREGSQQDEEPTESSIEGDEEE